MNNLACSASGSNSSPWPIKSLRGRVLELFFVLATLFAVSSAMAQSITEYSVTASSSPWAITVGPDGNLWFTEYSGGSVGRITPTGVITEFPVGPSLTGITTGPDGNLWLSSDTVSIYRVTPTGTVTAFALSSGHAAGITTGPDGNLWYTNSGNGSIGRMTTAGVVTEFPIAGCSNCLPVGITAGPDGNLWFTELNTGIVGKITTAGAITEYAIPGGASSWPRGIVTGPDGNLWFTEDQGNQIGVIAPDGTFIAQYPLPTGTPYIASSRPGTIDVGPDNNLWFALGNGNAIGSISTTGTIVEYPVPTANSYPLGIAATPDGRIWFTESSAAKVGVLSVLGPFAITTSVNVAGAGTVSCTPNPVASWGTTVCTAVANAGYTWRNFTYGPLSTVCASNPCTIPNVASAISVTANFDTVVVTGPSSGVQSVPTLSEWAMILLSALTAGTGLYLRRRIG